ncbi:MAG: hypothetical protein EXR71_09985 [Myxococcales bacterium]|nr:hypothetical protein [Myxococcales bacterium]
MLGALSAVWWLCSGLATSAWAKPPAVRPASFPSLVDADVVGTHPGALVTPEAWSALSAAAPTLAAPDLGKDAVVLRGPTAPRARASVNVALDPSAPTTLLLTYTGSVPRGTPVVRLVFRNAAGAPRQVDLRARDDVFPLDAAGASPGALAVDAGGGRALTVVHPGGGVSVSIEARSPGAGVVLLGVATGELLGAPRPREDSLDGFAFPLDIDTPAPPVPAGWRVEGNAGRRGKVGLKDGHLAYADGTRARFWGVNLVNAACYPTHEMADKMAANLADNGINLVRLHHFDSPKAGGLNPDRKVATDPLFLEDGLDRFDYLVSRLEAAGVYLLMETATNRVFTELDGVNDPSADIPNGHKGLPMVQPLWKQAYLDWATAWLGRTNKYTGRRYADDPGVAMVELANEHSMLMAWITGGVDRFPEVHRAEIERQWNMFVRSRYPDDNALKTAWTGGLHPGLQPGESLGSVRLAPLGQGDFRVWPTARVGDLYDFFLQLDVRFFDDVAAHVRGLGYTQPLIGGITWYNPAIAQVMSRYDVIDAHLEWDAPRGGVLRNASIIAEPRDQALLDRFQAAQVGKPMIISELNHGFPNDQMSEAPLFWASLAAVQDWDALIWFDYTNGSVTNGPGPVASFAQTRLATVKWGQMAAASGLFRSGTVAAASGLAPQWRSASGLRDEVIEGARPIYTGLRDVSVALSTRIREAYGGPAPLPIAGAPSPSVGWWPAGARFVIQTDALEAVLGDHGLRQRAGQGEGSGPVSAPHLDAQLEDTAAVSLLCTEGPIARCMRGLLTVAGRMENVGMRRIGSGTMIVDDGGGSTLLGRPAGLVRFAWPSRPTVRPIDADGRAGEAVPIEASGAGWWALPMVTAGPTIWWQVGS